jgi:hypothetical protein
MRLEKTQLVERAIYRIEKFPVIFLCAQDCDVHWSISAIVLVITTKAKPGSDCE